MEITGQDFEKIVDLDIGIDVTLRRKTQTIDPDYGSLISDSFQDHTIKLVWQEVTGEVENFRPEGEFKIGDIKAYAKQSYDGGSLIPDSKTDVILKDGTEYKIVKITTKTAGSEVIYKLLQLRIN